MEELTPSWHRARGHVRLRDLWLGPAVRLTAAFEVRLAWAEGTSPRTFAVKRALPPSDLHRREALVRELGVWRRLDAVHGLPTLGPWSDDAVAPWFATSFVQGVDLYRLSQRGPLPAPLAERVVCDLAGVLHRCHKRGVVHGDVAPTNVLIGLDGELKVLDFGLASVDDAHQRVAGAGTPAYLSPEAAAGTSLSPATDVYGLGLLWARCVLAEAPAQRRKGEGARLSDAQLQRVSRLIPATAPLLTACLAVEPRERPAPLALRRALTPGACDELAAIVRLLWRPPRLSESICAAEDAGEVVTDPNGETVTSIKI